MDCPKCDSVMEEITYHGISVDRCTICKGIWFPGIEHKELKRLKGSEVIDSGSPEVGKAFDGLNDVHCPECDKVMARVADKFHPHIHYEVCLKGDGVYFDAGEFKEFKDEGLGDFIKTLTLAVKKKKK